MNTRKTIIKTLLFTCALAFADTTLCAEKQDINDKLITLSGTIDSINGELSDQRATIGAIKSQVEHSNNQLKRQMLEELKTLQRQNQYLYDTLLAQKERNGQKFRKRCHKWFLSCIFIILNNSTSNIKTGCFIKAGNKVYIFSNSHIILLLKWHLTIYFIKIIIIVFFHDFPYI